MQETFTEDPLKEFKTLTGVTKDYVGKPGVEAALQGRSRDPLAALAELRDTGAVGGRIVEPSVFVEFLSREVRAIRKAVIEGVRKKAQASSPLRVSLKKWAVGQGMAAPKAEVLYERASAQLTYRVLGQAVFYLAYTGHTKSLTPFKVEAGKPLRPQLQAAWTSIRAVDYEALPAPTALDTLLPAGAYDPAAPDRNIST